MNPLRTDHVLMRNFQAGQAAIEKQASKKYSPAGHTVLSGTLAICVRPKA